MSRPKRKSKKRRLRVRAATPDRGPAPAREVRSPPVAAERESVEDPLEDWAEEDPDADRWLLERAGEDVQRGER